MANAEISEVSTASADKSIRDTLGEQLFNDYRNLVDVEPSFKHLDGDGNGLLAQSELKDAGGTQPRTKELLAQFGSIQGSSSDEWFAENDGISHNDLESKLATTIEDLRGTGHLTAANGSVNIAASFNPDKTLHSLEITDRSRSMEIGHTDNFIKIKRLADSRPVADYYANKQQYEQYKAEYGDDADRVFAMGPELFGAYSAFTDGGRNGAFPKIDTDSNGFLTRTELEQFTGSTGKTTLDEQRQLRAAKHMLSKLEEFQKASNDEYGTENEGITLNDISDHLGDTALARDAWGKLDVGKRLDWRLMNGFPGTRMDSIVSYSEQSFHSAKDLVAGMATMYGPYHKSLTIEDPSRNLKMSITEDPRLHPNYRVETDKLSDE